MDNQECYFCYICSNRAEFVCQCDIYLSFLCEEHFQRHIEQKDTDHKVYRLEEVLKHNPASSDCCKKLDAVSVYLRYFQEVTNLHINNLKTLQNLLIYSYKEIFTQYKNKISQTLANVKNLKTLLGSTDGNLAEFNTIFQDLNCKNLPSFLKLHKLSIDKMNSSFLKMQKSISSIARQKMYSNAIKLNPYRVFNTANKNIKKQFWDMIKIKQFAIFEGHTHPIHSLAITSDNKFIISGSADCTVRIWDLAKKRQVGELRHKDIVSSVVITKDDKYCISCSRDKKIKLWDIQARQKIATYSGHMCMVLCVGVTSDSKYIVSGDEEGYIFIWNLRQRNLHASMHNDNGSVHCLAILKFNKRLITSGSDSMIRVWNIKSLRQIAVMSGHSDSVYSLALTRDNRYIISASRDSTIRMFDVMLNRQVGILSGHSGSVYSVVVNSDNRYIISGGGDKTVRIWSLKDKKIEGVLRGYINNVYCVEISQDSRYIISGSGYDWFGMDNFVRVWLFYD